MAESRVNPKGCAQDARNNTKNTKESKETLPDLRGESRSPTKPRLVPRPLATSAPAIDAGAIERLDVHIEAHEGRKLFVFFVFFVVNQNPR